MSEKQLLITAKKEYTKLISICTIVVDWEDYVLMKNSFINNGFSGDCEYLVADNSAKNNFNAYSAIRHFLQQANGRFIMIVHTDVRCVDSKEKLTSTINSLEEIDPLWALCGNAGGNGYHNFYYNLDNNGRVRKSEILPVKVTSLDENLLIIKSDSQLTVSADIHSFHFYGTDLCIIADFLGYSAYVIDFMVKHLSLGNEKELEEYKSEFLIKYGKKFRKRFIQTTCTKFYLSYSSASNSFYNNRFIFFFVKAAQRISGIFKK